MTTLGSVAAQSAPASSWECVVVDNNSSDDTSEAVEAFAAGHPEISLRLVHEPQQGLSYARNCGIASSRGEYIAIIDDDERICEDFVAAYIDLFDSRPDAASAGGVIIAEYETGRPRWMSRLTERPIANPMYFGDRVRLFLTDVGYEKFQCRQKIGEIKIQDHVKVLPGGYLQNKNKEKEHIR